MLIDEARAALELRGALAIEHVFSADLAATDSRLGQQHKQIMAIAAKQVMTEQALVEARETIAAQRVALDVGAVQLAAAQKGRASVQRELVEERARSKRAQLGQQEKARRRWLDVMCRWVDRWRQTCRWIETDRQTGEMDT